MATNINLKQLKIDRNQRISMIAVSILMTVVIFTFFFVRKFYADYTYQQHVITEQNKIYTAIKNNQSNLDNLEQAFRTFDSKKPGLLGSNQPANVSNGVIILRAMPQKFDAPTAYEMQLMLKEFLTQQKYKGSVSVSAPTGEGVASPTPQPVLLNLSVQELTKNSLKKLVADLYNMIQPVHILNIAVTQGEDDSGLMTVTLGLQMFVQSDRNIEFETITIKRDGKTKTDPYVEPTKKAEPASSTDAPTTAEEAGEEEQ